MDNYEQKYKKALEKAQEAVDKGMVTQNFVSNIFPELKENEDERIRKEIIEQINLLKSTTLSDLKDKQFDSWIAWLEEQAEHANFRNKIQIGDKVTRNKDGVLVNLSQLNRVAKKDEKQDEQKPDDKVELKFHEGEWITNSAVNPAQISSIKDGMYFTHNDTIGSNIESIDKEYHLWTIQDAKDGDVLCCESGWTCIFKALDNHTNTFSSYCFMDKDKWFCNTGSECHTLDEAFIKAYNGEIYPATKEQRDLLFQKMHETGYEWDTDKKELKKIEQKKDIHNKLTAFEFSLKHIMEEAIEWGDTRNLKTDADLLLKIAQKTSWSEEDERVLSLLLNNFKQAVEHRPSSLTHAEVLDIYNWLKSLKERYTWKPSDLQMEALANALSLAKNCGEENAFDLRTLYEQLKKLRE